MNPIPGKRFTLGKTVGRCAQGMVCEDGNVLLRALRRQRRRDLAQHPEAGRGEGEGGRMGGRSMSDEGRAPEVDQDVDGVEGVPVPEMPGVLVEGEAGRPPEGAPETESAPEGGQDAQAGNELPGRAQAILDTWKRVKEEREAQGLIGRSPRSKTPLQLANQQGATWKRGLERFTRLKVDDVVTELSEMGVGTFARGILLAMEGPECPLCHRGGEPWAYQTYAKVARVIGDKVVGTQGTPVELLGRLISKTSFPELWEARNDLTALSKASE